MSLATFFKINLPYGMEIDGNDEWYLFNREYAPIGWNEKQSNHTRAIIPQIPITTKYERLTDKLLLEIAGDEKYVNRIEETGKIFRIWFYTEKTIPTLNKKFQDQYFQKLMKLSKLKQIK